MPETTPMANPSSFTSAELETECKVLAVTPNGVTGNEIGHLLLEIGVPDADPTITKWKRLYNAMVGKQNKVQVGNFLVRFINKAMALAKYVSAPELFRWRQDGLDVAHAVSGKCLIRRLGVHFEMRRSVQFEMRIGGSFN